MGSLGSSRGIGKPFRSGGIAAGMWLQLETRRVFDGFRWAHRLSPLAKPAVNGFWEQIKRIIAATTHSPRQCANPFNPLPKSVDRNV